MPAQLSLFSVGVRPPAYADLEGLLAGPGRMARREGASRLSLVLPRPDPWRVTALLAGLAELGLAGETISDDLGLCLRTPFAQELTPLAERWTSGALTTAPPGLALDGPRLRWWCLAAGHAAAVGYVLLLGNDEVSWSRVGGALAAAGIPGTLVRARSGGGTQSAHGREASRLESPAYRIVGARRLRRLAELIGPAPDGAAVAEWPGAQRQASSPAQ
jgi:hypothetical protein